MSREDRMRYFPVNLDLHGRLVVVVGGGAVAFRKVSQLLEATARVRIVAPALIWELEQLTRQNKVEATWRCYRHGDLEGAALVLAATDAADINRLVAAEARERGIPVNVADAPDAGTCTLSATMMIGDLQLAVSTGGRCPAFARWLARKLSEEMGPEYAVALDLTAAVREKLLTDPGRRAYNAEILAELLAADLPGLLRDSRLDEMDALLRRIAGPDYALDRLSLRTLPPWISPTN
jgi:precorrin-2 dehydrogenase/sirohydrochlorin ferrochelatase